MIENVFPFDSLIERFDAMAHEAGSHYQLAKQWGIPRQELSAMRNRRRVPPKRVLDKMGWEAVTVYRPKVAD